MLNQNEIKDIREKIKEIPKNCCNCWHLNTEYYEEYSSNCYQYCSINDSYWNLNSFPFKKEQKCFMFDISFLDYLDSDIWKLTADFFLKDDKKVLDKGFNLWKDRYWDLI
jgi:hypothetical protein